MKAHGVPLDIVDMAGGDDIDTRVFDGIERRGCRARAQRSRVHSVMPAALLLLLLALPGAVCRSVFPGKDTLRRTPEESREIVWRWAEPKRSCDDACASYSASRPCSRTQKDWDAARSGNGFVPIQKNLSISCILPTPGNNAAINPNTWQGPQAMGCYLLGQKTMATCTAKSDDPDTRRICPCVSPSPPEACVTEPPVHSSHATQCNAAPAGASCTVACMPTYHEVSGSTTGYTCSAGLWTPSTGSTALKCHPDAPWWGSSAVFSADNLLLYLTLFCMTLARPITAKFVRNLENLPTMRTTVQQIAQRDGQDAVGWWGVLMFIVGVFDLWSDIGLCAILYGCGRIQLFAAGVISFACGSGTTIYLGLRTVSAIGQTSADAAAWKIANHGTVTAILLLSAARIESLVILRLRLCDKDIIACPMQQPHFQFLKFAGWYHPLLADIPHTVLSIIVLQTDEHQSCRDCWVCELTGMSANTLAVVNICFSCFSMLWGLLSRTGRHYALLDAGSPTTPDEMRRGLLADQNEGGYVRLATTAQASQLDMDEAISRSLSDQGPSAPPSFVQAVLLGERHPDALQPELEPEPEPVHRRSSLVEAPLVLGGSE